MIVMNNNPVPVRELDLWVGKVIDPASGNVISSIENWSNQDRAVSNESFIATRNMGQGYHFLDLALSWSDWFQKTTHLQDIRRRLDCPRVKTSEKLAPFGWTVRMVNKWCCAVMPDVNFKGQPIPVRASRSFLALEQAEKAFGRRDFRAVRDNAMSALGFCGDCHQARMLIGVCCFRRTLKVPKKVKLETATYLLKHQAALQLAINTLSDAWGREQDRNPHRWAWIVDKIGEYENRLRTFERVFNRARAFLIGR